MASNSNSNTSMAGLFGQSLDGDLLFDQISGPNLFMPIPVAPVETAPPPVTSLPTVQQQHAQLPYQNVSSSPSSSFPTVVSSNSNQNTPPLFYQPQEISMSTQDLVGPPTAANNSYVPTQIQTYPHQQQHQLHQQSYQLQDQQHQPQHQQLYQQSHSLEYLNQQHQQPLLYQQDGHSKHVSSMPYNVTSPVTSEVPMMVPPPPASSTAMQNIPLNNSPPQRILPQPTTPQRPTQIVAPIPQQPVYGNGHLDSSLNPLHNDLPPTLKQTDPNVPGEYNTAQVDGRYNQPPIPIPVQAVTPHWFYCHNGKKWTPFSYFDSYNLEMLFNNPSGKKTICTDGGRFDVNLDNMTKTAVYWTENPCEVRRCSWFFKGGTESKLVPYDINVAELLENEYISMMKRGVFNIRVDVAPGKFVIFHNPHVLVQYTSNLEHVGWSSEDSSIRPKVVKRGIAEIQGEIERGEPEQIDHLVFVVHGIGPVADLRMRSIVECVDDFRKISFNQVVSHGFTYNEKPGSRVEFLPIHWHKCLRDDRHGVDRQLKALSLPSISKLRNFTNETLTDILFFTSPIYCQTICDTVVSEMNRIYKLFKSRNPSYGGSVSVVGHSLGSCILFDILAHQVDEDLNNVIYEDVGDVIDVSSSSMYGSPQPSLAVLPPSKVTQGTPALPTINELCTRLNLSSLLPMFKEEQIDTETIMMCSEADLRDLEIPFGPRKKLLSYIHDFSNGKTAVGSPSVQRSISQTSQSSTRGTQTPIPLDSSASSENVEFLYKTGNNGIGQPLVKYSKLEFDVSSLFCLGSPIGLFLTCRGIHSIGTDFTLPKCTTFMNIFHPYDPVVYRLEPLINESIDIPPSLIPHHKGRKRFHLEIKENLSRVGAHLKNNILDSVNRTWTSIKDFAKAHRSAAPEDELEEIQDAHPEEGQDIIPSSDSERSLQSLEEAEMESKVKSLNFGKLNNGNRVDYVLQENPFELINEYIFALSSHTCYWTSDDTALLIVDKIYKSL